MEFNLSCENKNEYEKFLIKNVREHNDEKALETLLRIYDKYILKVSWSIFSKCESKYTLDDVKQEVILAFIDIVKFKFNLDADNAFFTYMYTSLRLSSMKFIRNDKYFPIERSERLKKSNNVFLIGDLSRASGQTDKKEDDDNFINKNIGFCDITESIEYNLIVDSVDKLLKNDKDKYIFKEYFIKDKTQTEIAKKLNTHQSVVSKSITNSVNILREYWVDDLAI